LLGTTGTNSADKRPLFGNETPDWETKFVVKEGSGVPSINEFSGTEALNGAAFGIVAAEVPATSTDLLPPDTDSTGSSDAAEPPVSVIVKLAEGAFAPPEPAGEPCWAGISCVTFEESAAVLAL
jgi:hypothetical protein